MPDLTGKRVLILGAETDIGRAVTTAVAEAGANVAAVAATSDAEAAFAVQRLARRLSSGERKVIAQAIDATNEAAVRVMVRQVSKELDELDAVVFCADLSDATGAALDYLHKFGGKELNRDPRRLFVALIPDAFMKQVTDYLLNGPAPHMVKQDFHLVGINKDAAASESLVHDVLREVAAVP
jgi:NAD(P)-dependent dehydrogenase (short-subunit alcohol dehydrogenase family)